MISKPHTALNVSKGENGSDGSAAQGIAQTVWTAS
jgi:hypothetical protein